MQENRINNEYDRYLSPLDVWAIAFGCIIGWGAFIMPGTTFLPVAGPTGTLLSLGLMVAVMLVIGANFFFLMRRRPGTGGIYAYTKDAYGRDHAFLCAWFLTLSYLTILFMNATSLFLVIRMVLGRRLQIGYVAYNIAGNYVFLGEVGASIVALAIIALLFINAKPLLQHLQTILALVLLAAVVIVAGICLVGFPMESLKGAFGTQGVNRTFAVFSLVLLAPWAFVGFETISLETAHFDFKIQRSRWIIIAAIVLGGVVYAAMTLVGVSAVPDGYADWQSYIADLGRLDGIPAVPTFHAAQAIMGQPGLWIMAVAALSAILTGMIGAYRATTRMLSTMAEDRILSDKFTGTNNSITFIMLVSIVISLFGRNALSCFMELTSLGAIIGFGYTSAAAWRLARRTGNKAFAVTGLVGVVISVAFGVAQLIPNLTAFEVMSSDAFLLLSLWCLLGFLFYLRTVVRSNAAGGASTTGVVLFALLLYSVLMWLAKQLMAAESVEMVRELIRLQGGIVFLVAFIGLAVMLYIQRLLAKRHEELRARTADDASEPGDGET